MCGPVEHKVLRQQPASRSQNKQFTGIVAGVCVHYIFTKMVAMEVSRSRHCGHCGPPGTDYRSTKISPSSTDYCSTKIRPSTTDYPSTKISPFGTDFPATNISPSGTDVSLDYNQPL